MTSTLMKDSYTFHNIFESLHHREYDDTIGITRNREYFLHRGPSSLGSFQKRVITFKKKQNPFVKTLIQNWGKTRGWNPLANGWSSCRRSRISFYKLFNCLIDRFFRFVIINDD